MYGNDQFSVGLIRTQSFVRATQEWDLIMGWVLTASMHAFKIYKVFCISAQLKDYY